MKLGNLPLNTLSVPSAMAPDYHKVNKTTPTRNHFANVLNDSLQRNHAPYSHMADQYGTIKHNGVVFHCDFENNALCLGDMGDTKNVLTIPLSDGGVLKVHRSNIQDLIRAIDMFSAADIKRIMQAISLDAKIKNKQIEIEEEVSKAYRKKEDEEE